MLKWRRSMGQVTGCPTFVILGSGFAASELEVGRSNASEVDRGAMSEEELAQIERKLEQGDCRPEDMRRLIHAVRTQREQLDEIQRVLSDLLGEKH